MNIVIIYGSCGGRMVNAKTHPQEFRMCVHLFGGILSPGCANFGIKEVANGCEQEYWSDVANLIRHNFYVDTF